MKTNKKKTNVNESEEQILKKQARGFLLDEIYEKAESQSKARAKKKATINESIKIVLNSGVEIDVDEYVRENFAEPSLHFSKAYYYAQADLFGVSRGV